MDTLQEMNTSKVKKKKKSLDFSVTDVCDAAEACSGWLNEQVSPVKEIEQQMVNRIKTDRKKKEGKKKNNIKNKNMVLVSQVYSICGYQRQCPRT